MHRKHWSVRFVAAAGRALGAVVLPRHLAHSDSAWETVTISGNYWVEPAANRGDHTNQKKPTKVMPSASANTKSTGNGIMAGERFGSVDPTDRFSGVRLTDL